MATRDNPLRAIRPQMTVRQVAADFPGAEAVFRRYEEADDRAGKFGHLESLAHFARRRNLSLGELLSELAAATGAPLDTRSAFAERVHRPFLLAALAITLTLGAGWGGWLLWRIGVAGDFQAVPNGAIVAHGEAQLWGFMTLFIMGISLRTVLRAVPRHPVGRFVCRGLLAAGLLGIAGGFLWFLLPGGRVPWGIASAAALVLAAIAFWGCQLAVLWRERRAIWARAVMISGLWLSLWATATLVLRVAAGDGGADAYAAGQRLLLIELAVFGFAMNSIYGFGQLLLPGFLRIGSTRTWALESTWCLHNLGTAGFCAATIWPALSLLIAPASLLIAAGAVFYAIGQRVFLGRARKWRLPEKGHPALDIYPRLAFFWLGASVLMLAGGYVLIATGYRQSLPQPFVGAVRHALTVGFVTTLILGVGQRLLPVLEHRVLPLPTLVVPILILIGLGNSLRVGCELAVLTSGRAFSLMPLSAVLEWIALALFAWSVGATMWHVDPLLRRGRVTANSSVAVLLAEHPWLEDRLIEAGYGYLGQARSVPQELTFTSLAASESRDSAELVIEINQLLARASRADGIPPAATAECASTDRSRP